MREYRLLWLVWFIWAAWLLNKIFPDAGIIKWAGSLSAVSVPILIFYQAMMRKNRMKFFNRLSKSSQNGKKTQAPAPLSVAASGAIFNASEAKAQIKDRKALSPSDSDKSSLVANTMRVTGNLEGSGNVAIEGKVAGNITAQQVFITATGQVKGDIKAQCIIINGRAEGKLHADTVTLQRDGVIEGIIFTDELIIEKGGVFMGQSQKKSLSPAEKNRGKVKAVESENRSVAIADKAQQNEAGHSSISSTSSSC